MNSTSPRPPRRGLEAFASRDFTLYQIARMVGIVGGEAQAVAVAWQVYAITHRALDLGYTGLALFLPALLFLIPAGHVADRFDRRQVILVCYVVQFAASLALALMAIGDSRNVYAIYVVLFVIGMGRAFSGPAASALIPHLVPKEHLVNALTWGTAINKLANVTGPAVGGVLFALSLDGLFPSAHLEGAAIVYLFTLVLLAVFMVLVSMLRVRLGRMEHREISLKVILAGFHYVSHAPVLLGSISLDLFVVLLGGAVTLLPIFASDILHQGPRGFGLLRAAPAVGALAMSLFLARFQIKRHAGRKLFVSVVVFGLATVVFGFSTSFWVSIAALAVTGASDMVSMIIRAAVVQIATPPEMRGRVSAVNALFIGASNELGGFESGVTAQWWGAVWATIVGGIGSLVVAGAWAGMFPKLRAADELTPEALRVVLPAEKLALDE